jgi:site-specific DNA-methyltransferase (adenine-specific)
VAGQNRPASPGQIEYGHLEFTNEELAKLRAGRGGVWRLPPTLGGSHRDPLPRFTVLTDEQKQYLRDYFRDWGKLLLGVQLNGDVEPEAPKASWP